MEKNNGKPTSGGKLFSKMQFLKRIVRSLIKGLIIVAISLGIGMAGYHHYEKMDWVDSYVNAAMILSGMGPASALKTESGKLFAGTYALFSGIIFLFAIAIALAPVFHRFLHKFHTEERKNN